MISVENVSKVYHTRHHGVHRVLDNVSFKVAPGEKVGIMGRNGAGKSTLIRLIGGVEYPSAGRIRREMSVSWPIAHGSAFSGNLTGFDNVRFICRVYDVDYASVLPFVEDFTELGPYMREPVMHYSDGMRGRLAFALSMAIEFDCFLIDEVMAAGDHRFQAKCKYELMEKRKDRAIILVSHGHETIQDHCTRAEVLIDGKLTPFDSVDEARDYYVSNTGGTV